MRNTIIAVPFSCSPLCALNVACKSIRSVQQIIQFISVLLIILVVLSGTSHSTPPDYKTFRREQIVNYSPDRNDLLRIWIVYVGQGDGILIQLPPKFNYDPNTDDEIDEKTEHTDILIDGGSFNSRNKTKMLEFLQTLYTFSSLTIEHAIITHHDADHVRGLISIIKEPTIATQYIYHNGLASYLPTNQIIAEINSSAGAITKSSDGKIRRVMASLEDDQKTIKGNYLINGLDQLRDNYNQGVLQGIYQDLAQAIIDEDESQVINEFSRVWEGNKFIAEYEESIRKSIAPIEIIPIWPQKKLKAYKDWGQTINGNSVTFKIKYHDFEMLFTGDHNELSEKALVQYLKSQSQEELLVCDVLKVPHHGSKHNLKEFIESNGSSTVISVASMGPFGFGTSWKHPSINVVKWAGGTHRFYSTYIHERRFNWDDMKDEEKRSKMIETKHILIETDGKWFRVVEVDVDATDLNNPPTVKQTRRGNGTRWIKAN